MKELPTRQMLETYSERYPGMNAEAVAEALRLLRRGSLLMRELDAYFTGHTLSQTRFLVMIVIDRELERKSLLASEIADRLDISRPVVTETVKALSQAGLLSSIPDPEDGRAKRITLTPNGQAVLASLLPGYFAIIADFMARPADRTG
nr:MarR family transcriptional regulator [Methylobacterium sp. BTF04]